MRRVLVLGATGFIGGQVRRLLRESPDHRVMLGARRPPPPSSADDPAGETWCAVDLVGDSADQIGALLRRTRPDAVINCAGATSGDRASLDALNRHAVSKLVRAMSRYGGARLVHLGSAAEYGVTAPGTPISESEPCRPVGDYGASKLAGTEIVVAAAEDGALAATVLRVFNPLGAGAGEASMAGRAALALQEAVRHGVRRVEMGPLSSHRDFVDARDVAAAALLAAATQRRAPLLNVGRGEAVMARTVVRMLAAAAGFEGEIRESASASVRSAGVSWQQADIGAAEQLLGWMPRRSLDDAVDDLWSALDPAVEVRERIAAG